MKLKLIIMGILLFSGLKAQPFIPAKFYLSPVSGFDSSAFAGLKSNSISEIRLQGDSLVWVGTGAGLTVLRDTSSIFTLKTTPAPEEGTLTDLLPEGAVSALAVSGDTLFAAFAEDKNGQTAGSGFTYSVNSVDSSITWNYFKQPVDATGDSLAPFAKRFFKALPITVTENNITYDASMAGGYIWVTSWAGGLRRYNISEKVWERVPLPLDGDQTLNTCEAAAYEDAEAGQVLKDYYLNPRDPWDGVSTKSGDALLYGHHNHKGFSVLAYADTVWVGTANGINRGILGANGCINWKHFVPGVNSLSGGFVVGLAKQEYLGYRIIWAATLSTGAGESMAVSYSLDDGETWQTTLAGERAYNIEARDSLVFVSTDNGLWKFIDENPLDLNKPWALYKPARQALPIGSTGAFTTDEILSNRVVTAVYENRAFYSSRLWIGTDDGLGRALDIHGENWQIFRSNYDRSKVYAYPNPFSPYNHNLLNDDGYVRFNTDVRVSFVINMDIYNFAFEKVYSEDFDRRISSSGSLKWSGRDQDGNYVANGTYFIRIKYDNNVNWVKLIVVK
ncbi:MAG: hypothetical protein V3S22_01725 [Candidatus Neomarinimicrobiota bacterium]